MTKVGRILFIDADGKAKFTADYAMPDALREPEIYTKYGVFRQNHQLPTGGHVYKYFRPLIGPPDQYLTDYRLGTDANWDGPPTPPRKANWDDVEACLTRVRLSGCLPELYDELKRVIAAVRDGKPAHGLPDIVVSVTRPSPPPLRKPDQGSDFDGFILEEEEQPMADLAIRAMVQSLLGGSTSKEETLLLNELARRLVLSGLQISTLGTISVTVPFIDESALLLTDVTTANSSTSKHGFLKKLDNDATHFMDGTGAWAAPSVAESAVVFTDITTGDVTSTKHGYAPKSPADNTKFLRGGATADWAVPPVTTDATLTSTDVTTNNVTSTKHGFAPKSPGTAGKFLNGAATPDYAYPAETYITNSDTGTKNDYAPGLAGHTVLQWVGASSITITGFAGGVAGQKITFIHGGTGAAIFSDQSGSSSVGNKLFNHTSATRYLGPGGIITYEFNGTLWLLVNYVPYSGLPFALTDGATPALDASQSNIFTITAAGNRTIAVPTNPTAGQKITIIHLASGADRTLALNTGAGGFRFGTSIAALTATTSAKKDYIGAIYNAADTFWDVVAYSKGF